ncbi:TIGR02206 family membrane protein [Solibacillus daqui]|uniref:YwaF family protein n=1 Tax=Solibacillus daqui TaxID=2912187 RepID=UPI0023650F47|nr:TIGR02206 family membrane protein [Solibacillus daqui]
MLNEKIQSLENGFRLFDWYHLSWLMLTGLVICIMYKIYSSADIKRQKKIRIRLALVILLLESKKNLVLVWQGEFWYGSLPLHLCGLGIFIVLAHALLKGHHLDMLLYFLTMPGAFMSLLTPDWTNVSAFNYLHFHSFLFHVLLFAYPVTMLLSKELTLSIRKMWQPILFSCVTVPVIYILNVLWGTNFMFINQAAEGTPLMLLEQYLGRQYYILGFIGLVMVFWLLLLLPIIVCKKTQY